MNSSSRDRLLVSLAVLIMVLTFLGPIIIFSVEASISSSILAECQKDKSLPFDFCWHKSRQENTLAVWYYFTPFLIPILAIWSKWVWQIPYPTYQLLFESRSFRIFEGLLLSLSLFLAGKTVWEAITSTPDKLQGDGLGNGFLLSICFAGSVWIISKLLNRNSNSKIIIAAKWAMILSLITPFLYFGIGAARQFL